MHLSPKESDRLLLFLAAELARRRRGAGRWAMTASARRHAHATDAAIWSVERAIFVGSKIPAATRSTGSPVSMSRPWPGGRPRTRATATEGSRPAFEASWRSGASSAVRTAAQPADSWPAGPGPSASAVRRSVAPPPDTIPPVSAARPA